MAKNPRDTVTYELKEGSRLFIEEQQTTPIGESKSTKMPERSSRG